MEKKYQVFISSTFQDLETERRVVIEQILNLGHIPVGMELFQATDESQWSYITRRILDCDYYVLIVAERYGSEKDGISYTQMEYEFAIQNEIPVAAFLLHQDSRDSWPQSKIEFDKRDKIKAFRELCQQRLVRHWKNADDLGLRVMSTLVELFRERPMTGWVKANTVGSAEALNEIARLSEEKRALSAQLDQYVTASTGLKIPSDVLYRIESLASKPARDFMVIKGLPTTFNASVLEVFLMHHRMFSLGCSSATASIQIAKLFVDGASGSAQPLLAELSANNLIDVTYVQSTRNNRLMSDKHLLLTVYGKQFVMYADRWSSGS